MQTSHWRAGLTALTLTAGVSAEPVPEVIVTAELRAIPLLEQAGSTSIVDGESIRRRAARHLEDVLGLAPNVNMAGGSSRGRFYQIRGIGERSQFVEPLNPSVGLLIDNIDFSGLGTAALLFDAEQVEVLRGPQGTLHGANALAGLIKVRTAQPEAEFGGRVEVSTAQYDTRNIGASITGPVSDSLYFRLGATRNESDGYMKNAFLNSDNTNQRDESSVSGKLRWLIDESNTLDLTLLSVDINNGYDAFSLDNTRTTLSDEPGYDALETLAGTVRWTGELKRLQVEASLSHADTDTDYAFDEDWSFIGIAPELEYSSFDQYLRTRESNSAELRLSSRTPINVNSTTIDWVAGVYALRDDEELTRSYTYLAEDFRSRYRATTSAAYGQLTIAASDRLSLDIGLRVARRDMDYSDSNAVDSNPSNALWGGKLSLQYLLSEDGLLYASVSRGYRAGGVNAGVLATDASSSGAIADARSAYRFFDEELLLNYEIGHKSLFAEGRLSSRIALFWMDRKDQQVRGSLVLPRTDGSTAFIDYTDNAASGTNFGMEWELDWRPIDALALFASVGLLDTSFDDYVNAAGDNLSGREQAHAPGYQFAAGATLEFAPAWYLRAEVEGRDAFYFSDRHDARSEDYALLHLRLGYQGKSWEAALWARNLGDENYAIRGFGSFGNDPRKGYAVEPYYQYGEPRVVGATLAFRF